MARRGVSALALFLASATAVAQPERAELPPETVAAQPAQATASPQGEVEQLVAPIALHPDALVSQILMASTYPLEVVQAERWVKADPNGAQDPEALNAQPWDPSVKSLTGFPDVLTMMSEQLDWTTKLGDAFLADQKSVLDAIQRLRARAKSEGNLETTQQQIVNVENTGGTEVIVIESSDPEIVYVPSYDPVVVYGGWPYPSYPPYSYYSPGYVAGTALLSFGVGVACGAAWGHAWGDCDWHGGDVDIDIDKNFNFNQNIDRSKYKAEIGSGGRGKWQHDSSHRGGVAYRDNATAQKYGRGSDARAAQSREQYRGRAEAGQRELSRDAGAGTRDGARTADRSAAGSRDRSAGSTDRSAGSRDRSAGSTDRSSGSRSSASRSSSGSRSSGFSSGGRSSSSTRAASSRGGASRSAGASRGGGGRGGRR